MIDNFGSGNQQDHIYSTGLSVHTEDVEETLDALGYTWEQIMADKRLLHGLKMAQKKITGQG